MSAAERRSRRTQIAIHEAVRSTLRGRNASQLNISEAYHAHWLNKSDALLIGLVVDENGTLVDPCLLPPPSGPMAC